MRIVLSWILCITVGFVIGVATAVASVHELRDWQGLVGPALAAAVAAAVAVAGWQWLGKDASEREERRENRERDRLQASIMNEQSPPVLEGLRALERELDALSRRVAEYSRVGREPTIVEEFQLQPRDLEAIWNRLHDRLIDTYAFFGLTADSRQSMVALLSYIKADCESIASDPVDLEPDRNITLATERISLAKRWVVLVLRIYLFSVWARVTDSGVEVSCQAAGEIDWRVEEVTGQWDRFRLVPTSGAVALLDGFAG